MASDQLHSFCPLCASKGCLLQKMPEPLYGQQFDVHKCSVCSVCYTFPQPSVELLTRIYSGEYWLREKKGTAPVKLTGLVQRFNKARLAAMIHPLTRRLKPGDRILEVGCGSGQLAVYLQDRGFEVEVTDVSREILDEILMKNDIKGYCGDLQHIEFSGKLYQAVIFNNVLEHLSAPAENLLKAAQLVDSTGYIFVEVPNIAGIQFALFRSSWFPLQLPEHLFHFSPDSLQKITQRCGLKQVWFSTFSPRVSPAGYVASIFPFLRPDRLRHSMSKPLLALYLGLQMVFFPVAYVEALFNRGSAVRALYQKRNVK